MCEVNFALDVVNKISHITVCQTLFLRELKCNLVYTVVFYLTLGLFQEELI